MVKIKRKISKKAAAEKKPQSKKVKTQEKIYEKKTTARWCNRSLAGS